MNQALPGAGTRASGKINRLILMYVCASFFFFWYIRPHSIHKQENHGRT